MAFLRRLSIRSQLFILAGSFIIVILIIIFHSYSTMSGMITRNHEEYVKQTISEIQKNVTSNKDVIYRLMQNISYNEEVQNYLVEKNALLKYDMFKKLNKLFISQRELKEGILDIVLSGNNGQWVDLYGGNKYVSALRDAVPPKVNAYYSGVQRFGTLFGGEEGLVFATSIYYMKQGELFNTRVGTMFFIVDPKALVGEQDYSSKQTNTQIYLLDRDQKVITSNLQNVSVGTQLTGLPSGTSDGSDKALQWNNKLYVMQRQSLPDIDGSILSMAPKDELLRDLLDIRRQELLILAICLLILAIPFMFIINNILRPLKKMMFFMTTVKRGDLLKFKKRISLQGYMEISIMASELNSMLDEIDQLTQRLIETNTRLYGIELEKKKSELAFLRSQINPHFLYNTLEAITGIAVVNKQNQIKTMTRALSSIFRYSIKGTGMVPLSEELGIIKSFVSIQQIRFKDRFSVDYECTEEALAYRVPKMILQPLVENAVYHGFEPRLKHGLLEIRGFVDEQGSLVVRIVDDGMGIDPVRLTELRALLAAPPSALAEEDEEQRSIGLVNVNNRIRLMFGEACGMRVESTLGSGTAIELTIAGRRELNA
ncbi:sensor histidine kinase [Paenibacillus sepulcri]|uniref:Histidine kinase n=1 Tax=Paenibacillus sepulcri TaxID=359917 RepID=A0ABS7C206_9BACL|nr:histidine kinase [Paenibacillus sepulcri]